jgi:hypothetical protein
MKHCSAIEAANAQHSPTFVVLVLNTITACTGDELTRQINYMLIAKIIHNGSILRQEASKFMTRPRSDCRLVGAAVRTDCRPASRSCAK